MTLYAWLRTQLEIHEVGIAILFILSSVFTITGVSMPSLLSSLLNTSPEIILKAVAILNTVITFIVAWWGMKESRKLKGGKDLLIKAKNKLIDAHNLVDVIVGTKKFVLSELIVKYNEEDPIPGVSKDQAEAIGLYKKDLSDFEEMMKQI